MCCGEVFDVVRGSHPFNAADMDQRTGAELLRRSPRAFRPKALSDSPGWTGHQIVKLPAEYAVGIGKIEHDAHVVEIRNREQFGTFVPGTQQLT